jgi:type III secretion protein HrpB1
MPTEVAFSASRNITEATSIGNFATDLYARIRVLATQTGGDSTLEVRLVISEGEGALGDLDRYLLDQGESVQRVYEVPGTRLGVYVTPLQSEASGIDVWIWGYKAPGE